VTLPVAARRLHRNRSDAFAKVCRRAVRKKRTERDMMGFIARGSRGVRQREKNDLPVLLASMKRDVQRGAP